MWNLYFAAWLQLCLRTHWTCRCRVICMFATNVFSFASQREATPSVHEHCVQRYCTSECDATITRSRFTCCKISQCQHTPHISYTHGGGIWRIFCDFKVWYIYIYICFQSVIYAFVLAAPCATSWRTGSRYNETRLYHTTRDLQPRNITMLGSDTSPDVNTPEIQCLKSITVASLTWSDQWHPYCVKWLICRLDVLIPVTTSCCIRYCNCGVL